MRQFLVLFIVNLLFSIDVIAAGCAYYLQYQAGESELVAIERATFFQKLLPKLHTQVIATTQGYSVYLIDNTRSKKYFLQAQQILQQKNFQTQLRTDCREYDVQPMKVSEDMSKWPYQIEPAKTMEAVSPDTMNQKKAKFINLKEAILLGLRFSPDVKNIEIDKIIQKFDLKLNDWQFEWQYDLKGHATWTNIHDHSGDSTSHSYSVDTTAKRRFMTGTDLSLGLQNNAHGDTLNPKMTLNLSQPLLRASSKEIILNGWNDTLDNNEIFNLNFKQTLMVRINDIIKNYRQLIVNNNNLTTAKHALHESVRTFKNNKVQIRLGRMAKTVNIPQASQVESNKLALEQTRNQILQSKQTLLKSIGVDPDELINVPADVVINNAYVPDEQETIEYALRHNIDYQVKLINLRKSKRAVVKARDNLRWDLSADASVSLGTTGGYGQDARLRSLVNGRNHNESAGLTLQIPVNRKDLQYALSKQILALEKEKNNLYRSKRDLITTVKNMLINIRSQLKQLKIAEKAQRLSKQTYDITLKKQQLGRASSLQVTQSQNDLVQKRINLIQTKVNYLNAMTDLDLLLGNTLKRWKVRLRV